MLRIGFPHAFERWTIDFAESDQELNQDGELLRCGFDITSRILHRSVSRGEKRRSLDGVQHSFWLTLAEVWKDHPQYGDNLQLPSGAEMHLKDLFTSM